MPAFLPLRPLTDDEIRSVERLAHARTEPARVVERAQIIWRAHQGERVPVIALTANAFAEDRKACIDAGMDAFVVKPFDRETLEAAIDSARGVSAKRAADAA